MRSVLPALQEEQTEKVEDHIFRIYDINNDGIVSFHEFMTVFMILTGRNREVYVVNLNFLTIEKIFLPLGPVKYLQVTTREQCWAKCF